MMERKDITVLGLQALAHLVEQPPKDARTCLIRMTSGTSGAPVIIATEYSQNVPEEIAGNESISRMVTCIGSMTARLANTLLVERGSAVLRTLPVDPVDLDPQLTALLQDFVPESIHGFCSFVARVAAYISVETAEVVRMVKLTGEPLSAQLSTFFRERFPHARQTEIYLASEVGGRIGVQCPYLLRNQFHPASGVIVEIYEPEEGIGDVLITKTFFRSMHVKQYRIGDLARWMSAPCECGERRTFQLLGRKGVDYLKVAGVLVRAEEVERSVASHRSLIDDYRLEVGEIVSSVGVKGKMTLFIFRRAGAGTPALAKEIALDFSKTMFVTPTQTLFAVVHDGLFEPLSVKFVEKPFPAGHKDIKLYMRNADILDRGGSSR